MPFKKGNPGRGFQGARQRRLINDLLEPHLPTAAKKLLSLMESEDQNIQLKAAKEIVERICGKARQEMELSGGLESPLIAVIKELKK